MELKTSDIAKGVNKLRQFLKLELFCQQCYTNRKCVRLE